MKITVEIPDEVYKKAKIAAIENHITLKEIIVSALSAHLAEGKKTTTYPDLSRSKSGQYRINEQGFVVYKKNDSGKTVSSDWVNAMRDSLGI